MFKTKTKKLYNYIVLLRPQQWIKNFFIFIPLFFSGHLWDLDYLLPTFMMFIAYSFAASGIYCFNDIYDAEVDKLHPDKCKRPIASGVVRKGEGYLMMVLCFGLSFLFIINNLNNGNIRLVSCGVIAFYILMNIAYCIRLKHIAIVDVFIIAVGFVLRIIAGGVCTGIYLSHWIVLMVFLLALFLAFAKRRDDVVMYEETGSLMRRNIERYNLTFMNQVIGIEASIMMVCYIMYTVSPEVIERFQNKYIYMTSVFVLAGVIRYLQITIVDVKSGSPTKVLLKDRFIQICILSWIAAFLLIIYYK